MFYQKAKADTMGSHTVEYSPRGLNIHIMAEQFHNHNFKVNKKTNERIGGVNNAKKEEIRTRYGW